MSLGTSGIDAGYEQNHRRKAREKRDGMREFRVINAHVLDGLRSLPDESVQCCVTSPPYWGLRAYGTVPQEWGDGWVGEFGAEPNPEMYTAHSVEIFAEVRRVLRSDGTCWLNLGDSYAGGGGFSATAPSTIESKSGKYGTLGALKAGGIKPAGVLKSKDLVGIPWRVAFALQADGWYLRSDIIWAKPNPMPESVTDRPTKAHEYLFLLSKSQRYSYNASAIAELALGASALTGGAYCPPGQEPHANARDRWQERKDLGEGPRRGFSQNAPKRCSHVGMGEHRNKRTVWSIPTEPFPDAHFAVMPTALVEPCILAGSATDGTVLDPFNGSGTVGVVALRHERRYIGIELNPEYAAMARERILNDAPMFNREGAA